MHEDNDIGENEEIKFIYESKITAINKEFIESQNESDNTII